MDRTKKVVSAGSDSNEVELHEAICLDAAENVDANFVSIWRFDRDLSKILCLYALDVTTGDTSDGQELKRDDFPKYFETILEETTISAAEACTHPQTRELADVYFRPNGIVSLLDFIVHKNFQPVGIICCESKGKRRDWSEANRTYLRSLATFASFKANV